MLYILHVICITTYLESLQVGRLGQEVRQICQTDPGESEIFQIDERHSVAIEERHILRINVKDVICRFLNVQ